MEHLPQQDTYYAIPREDVAPFVPRRARSALDVGCARGGFGPTLRTLLPDARIVGVEPVPDQARVARSTGAYDEVIDGYFPDALGAAPPRFDVVFFNDVLEHVYDPWATLARVHDVLTPEGQVVAAIPSIQYAPVVRDLLRGRWDYADSGTLDRTHVRFFTKATMVEMFEGAGFRVDQCVGANSAYNWHWPKRTVRRRAWFRLFPDSEWVHFIVVATSLRAAD